MNIVLVKPPLTADEIYKGLAGAGSALPPLGLATLAAVVRQAGHAVRIIDAAALRLTIGQTVRLIVDSAPDVVGLTAVTAEIFHAEAIASAFKQALPRVPVVLGGPHVTAAPEETLSRFPNFDLAVLGEGEETFTEWLACVADGSPADEIRGLLLRREEGLERTPPRPAILDLDSLPFPAWDLLPSLAKKYHPAADTLHRFPASLLITSRGCPFHCVFCDRSVFGNKVRAFSAGYVVEMIKVLRNTYGIRDVFIEDDNFIALKQRALDISELLRRQRVDMTWSCLGRVDAVSPDFLRALRRGGCWQINYGCESGAQEILDNLHKGIRVERMEEALAWTRDAGLNAKGLFMAGCFGETRETLKKTLAFIRSAPLTDFHITAFTPLPGAQAYIDAPAWGDFDPSWENLSMFSPGAFVPRGLSSDDIREFIARAYRTFYLRPDILRHYASKLLRPSLYPRLARGFFSFLKLRG